MKQEHFVVAFSCAVVLVFYTLVNEYVFVMIFWVAPYLVSYQLLTVNTVENAITLYAPRYRAVISLILGEEYSIISITITHIMPIIFSILKCII